METNPISSVLCRHLCILKYQTVKTKSRSEIVLSVL